MSFPENGGNLAGTEPAAQPAAAAQSAAGSGDPNAVQNSGLGLRMLRAIGGWMLNVLVWIISLFSNE
jgi:hypothetical protein